MDILPRAAASKRQSGRVGVMPLGIMYDDDREPFIEASERYGSAGRSAPHAVKAISIRGFFAGSAMNSEACGCLDSDSPNERQQKAGAA